MSELQIARRGVGALLQRDYWAVIRNCRASPTEILATVRRHFPAFAPEELVAFSRVGHEQLELGDEFSLRILGAGTHWVRVIHLDEQSVTLGTVTGHPEAGRITFGSYRNARGDVIFHIRSHARSRSRLHRVGFLAMGEVMQTSTWTEFVNRVAALFGDGVIGFVHAETRPCSDEGFEEMTGAPTYLARDS